LDVPSPTANLSNALFAIVFYQLGAIDSRRQLTRKHKDALFADKTRLGFDRVWRYGYSGIVDIGGHRIYYGDCDFKRQL
jgi:hypothetical protein